LTNFPSSLLPNKISTSVIKEESFVSVDDLEVFTGDFFEISFEEVFSLSKSISFLTIKI